MIGNNKLDRKGRPIKAISVLTRPVQQLVLLVETDRAEIE